ncbi:DUF512 domain-containing protein [Candidatus Oleimmundimicrobium sp.]|uniref:DUF512 domain-containing protein n=1 Tax=Candidatus Oleimmundimicrobium sp. TaxID=3060597 RepID=UPI00271FBE13|nr:DUF512 domain-containing protein [Candidatus Oleimmundimicrobium sp.]MDO8885304.1 DUF512 domain-containing protein [Candidatus Oleimmundimicrobium sp.]
MIAKIDKVRKGSIADMAGVRVGNILENINNIPLRDIIDFQIYSDPSKLNLNILRNGQKLCIKIEKAEGEPLGVKFSSSIFDKLKFCKNRCLFCFIDQLPPRVRKSLLIKDDDYRLSFLYGNFVTLTNLSDSELERIIEQRLSPLYVSLHSTDLAIRSKLIRPRAGDKALEYLKRLLDAGIRIHIQIVLCPGINDGDNLMHTLIDLSTNYSGIESVGIVPVGLTSYREKLYPLRSFTPNEAGSLIEEIEVFQKKFLKTRNLSRVFLADEFYLMSGKTLPDKEHYGDFPQIENGIGLARLFLSDFEEALAKRANALKPLTGTVLTGEMPESILKEAFAKLKKFNIYLKVKKVPNKFFGGEVNVTGLVTGSDILNTAKDEDFEAPLFLPDIMLNEGKLFLDDINLNELEQKLKVPICLVSTNGKQFIEDLIKVSNRS